MIITAVRLTNIKSFIEGELQFARGINVIAGRNGAGKSTVIEAVGLALFDAWPQRFKDGNARTGFLRNGEREGRIEVDVQRGDRRLTVRCDLGSRRRGGRDIIDYERRLFEEQGAEIAASAGRKKEFQDDVREHILGSARIDDDELFRNIIGTEQGGFDDPFTRPEKERAQLFEKILGIEDFQYFDRQFWSLVKLQNTEAETLRIRVEEHAGLPAQLEDARNVLAEREDELNTAVDNAKATAKEAEKARKAVEKLAGKRDALQKAIGEHARLTEKLNAAEAAQEKATELVKSAGTAAAALLKALPGYEAWIAAEKELQKLRGDVKARDAAKESLAGLRERYETKKAALNTQCDSLAKQKSDLAKEITDGEKDLAARDQRMKKLREEYQQLQVERKLRDSRAALARDLASYVQDLNTVQQTLDNADESMRLLRDTFTGIREQVGEMDIAAEYFPDLSDRSEHFFARHISAEGGSEVDAPFAPLLALAETEEERLRKEAAEAADRVSRKKQEGKSEKESRKAAAKSLEKMLERTQNIDREIATATKDLANVEDAWKEKSAELNAILQKHAELDAGIARQEATLETHRQAHDDYLTSKQSAEELSAHEKALEDARALVRETTSALTAAKREVNKLRGKVSEEEFAEAKQRRDDTQVKEKEAATLHSTWKALVKEQKSAVQTLEKQVKEYERLQHQSVHARTEADFSGEVHAKVVRELARHVGASIVSALSAFAAELYQRIAPEQELALHWDAENYAVELRGEQGTVRGRELSGGQLMGVSLAVKLALIKWYSQCRVGFLDEPTTHLDRETRSHLAEVIQHLEDLTSDGASWFDQLFVISHEESFAGAGHLVELERDPAHGSRVRAEDRM